MWVHLLVLKRHGLALFSNTYSNLVAPLLLDPMVKLLLGRGLEMGLQTYCTSWLGSCPSWLGSCLSQAPYQPGTVGWGTCLYTWFHKVDGTWKVLFFTMRGNVVWILITLRLHGVQYLRVQLWLRERNSVLLCWIAPLVFSITLSLKAATICSFSFLFLLSWNRSCWYNLPFHFLSCSVISIHVTVIIEYAPCLSIGL